MDDRQLAAPRRSGSAGTATPGRRHAGRGGPSHSGDYGGGAGAAGRWRRKALAVAGITVGVLVLVVVAVIGIVYATTRIPSAVAEAAVQQQSVVYFAGGQSVLGRFGATDRQLLSYNQIPQVMRDAALAAEDRNFYHEGAISPPGILRAAYDDIFHGGAGGGSLAGGSTITQEFVRNYYAGVGRQQTVGRKVKEVVIALKVSKQKSKDWILTQYLNTVYLGDGAYGVGAAARTYFGKPANKLTTAQAAMIAAMIQEPGYYSTPAGHQALVARWRYVLSGLVKMGDLTSARASELAFPKMTAGNDQQAATQPYAPYLLQMVRNELEDTYHYSRAQVDNDGLRIVTTLNKSMIGALDRAVTQNEETMAAGGEALPWYAHVGAELQNPKTGAILAVYAGPGQNMNATKCRRLDCDLNTTLTREQVGSSFKPYVLSTAVKQGMNTQTSTLDGDSPLWVPPDSKPRAYATTTPTPAPYYMVSNDASDGSVGPVSVTTATAMSLNSAYTDLWHRVGGQNVVDMASEFGVNAHASGLQAMRNEAGVALGQASLSVNEQDTMLATIDDHGQYHDAHVIANITRNTTQGRQPVPVKVASRQVLTPAQDSQVAAAMSEDTSSIGTAPSAAMSDGRPIIGKTGTTNTGQSAFFLGAIPQYALTVALFSNEQNGTNSETLNGLGGSSEGGYGGWWPAKIWRTFAEQKFLPLPVQQFPTATYTGTAWNLMGPGQAPPPATASPSTSPTVSTPAGPSHSSPPGVSTSPAPKVSVPAAPTGQFGASPPSDVPASPPTFCGGGAPCGGASGGAGRHPGTALGAGARGTRGSG